MMYKKRKKIIPIKNNLNSSAVVLQGIAALFCSTKNNQNLSNFTILTVFFIFKRVFSIFHSGRAPPFHTGFSNKNRFERNENMFFSKKLKVFSEKLADGVFLNVVMSEGDKETALRKRKEVNSNGDIFFPKGTC